MNYYNENDPKAAVWLRELIKSSLVAPGDVDERSIEDVLPNDLKPYTQCHFFAGIGVWSYALRLTGWPDDQPVWTGSCPCQPFSTAGKAKGFADERHLWPAWHYLIEQCRPEHVFGEQVASKDGLGWLDLVQTDLEGTGYACGAVDLCAAGIGAPHIRQRLWFVAERVGDPSRARLPKQFSKRGDLRQTAKSNSRETFKRRSASIGGLADADGGNAETERLQRGGQYGFEPQNSGISESLDSCPTNGFWRNADWLYCRDGKWRAVEPGTFPLVDGAAARVGRLRGYGNALVAPVAQSFIEAYMDYEAASL